MRGSCFSISNHVFILSAAALEAFATIAHQLLQDVQERLVFRAHLYLQSDIQNYNPSTGDLAYPEKLEMMEVRVEIANLITNLYLSLPPHRALHCPCRNPLNYAARNRVHL